MEAGCEKKTHFFTVTSFTCVNTSENYYCSLIVSIFSIILAHPPSDFNKGWVSLTAFFAITFSPAPIQACNDIIFYFFWSIWNLNTYLLEWKKLEMEAIKTEQHFNSSCIWLACSSLQYQPQLCKKRGICLKLVYHADFYQRRFKKWWKLKANYIRRNEVS